MTTSHHIHGPIGAEQLVDSTMQGRLHDLAVAAVLIAAAVGLAFGISWLVPLEFVVPRPR